MADVISFLCVSVKRKLAMLCFRCVAAQQLCGTVSIDGVDTEIADGLGYSPLMIRTREPYKQVLVCHFKVEYTCPTLEDMNG